MLPRITPLRLGIAQEPFDHPAWLFELKYDGWRALAYLEDGKVQLTSRKGRVYQRFDGLCSELAGAVRANDAILDGEIVCFDQDGRPQFNQLLYRRAAPSFVAFDVCWLKGTDYRAQPLLTRKSILSQIIPRGSDCILRADHVLERGVDLFRLACERDLEGVVAKLGQAPYQELHGRPTWLKIRNPKYTQNAGRGEQFQRRLGR